MFTNFCFIRKNTPELREKLIELGYKQNEFDFNDKPWLATNYNMFIGVDDGFQNLPLGDTDCGENETLFLAIAALRDDTDKNQWFTDGNIWEMSETDLPSKYMQLEGHKATLEELIEEFKI